MSRSVCKGSWPVPSRGRWSVHVGRRVVPHRPSPAPPSRTLSPNWTLDPLGGGTPPIYWSGAKAGMLSDRDVHHPELAVSGFGNRNAGVGFLDTRLVSFLIPCRWILRVVGRSSPPAPVRAPLVEAPLECRAAPQPPPGRRAEPRPPNWPAQRRPPLLLGTGAAMPVPRQSLKRSSQRSQRRSAELSLVHFSGELGGRPVVCRCWLRCALASPAAPRSLRRPVAAVAAPPCVLAAAPVAQDPTALAARQTIQRRIRRMALTFTVCCPKPFGGSASMQRRSLKH